MSGLAGHVVLRGSIAPVDAHGRLVAAMADRVRHRGPIHAETTRSAVLGVHAGAGLARLRDPQGRPTGLLAFDGRIDELDTRAGPSSRRPEAATAHERSVSDADGDAARLAAAISAVGPLRAVERTLGDYAVAWWDSGTRRLWLARDAMGMRPLYVWSDGSQVLVASEIRELLGTGVVPDEIDEATALRFLVGSFSPLERTFRRHVRQVPPGELWEIADGVQRRHRFGELWTGPLELPSTDAYIEAFAGTFRRAVADRVRGRGAIGVMLSGGLDSGGALSMAASLRDADSRSAPDGIRAYTWSFDTVAAADERHLARPLADALTVPLTEVSVDDALPIVDPPNHPPHPDDPFVGAYQPIIERTLERARADGVTRMLSADRGDLTMGTMLISYPRLLRSGRWRDLADEVARHATLPDETVRRILLRFVLGPAAKAAARRISAAASRWRPNARDAGGWQGLGEGSGPPAWVRRDALRAHGVDPSGTAPSDAPALDGAGRYRAARYRLLSDPMHARSMVWSERTNAAFGQGFIDPYSDIRVARFALSVPQQLLNPPGRNDKRFLRAALRGIMPEAQRAAAAKIVPTPLYERQLRQREVARVESLLTESIAAERGWIDPGPLRRYYDDVRRGAPISGAFWWALATESWLRRTKP